MNAFRRAVRFFLRALVLKCPECGVKPMFVPLARVRSLHDWFTPLDGCPRCGYAYERETGYFLLAIWMINYGVGSLLGIGIYLVLELRYHLDLRTLLIAVISPVVLFNILFARHSKAFFLALDHYFDPHKPDSGDGGGNRPVGPAPKAPTEPSRPCEPLTPVT